MADSDYRMKLLLIGDSGVGKSCLLLRFCDDSFATSFITTIGIDFKVRTIDVDGKKVRLQIWDTAGQERFRTITTAYYRGAMGILLVYDITDSSSFQNVRNWIGSITEYAAENVNVVLVGNKADMEDSKRQVTKDQGQALADEYKIKFFEASAKTKFNVEEVFESIARDIKTRLEETSSKIELPPAKFIVVDPQAPILNRELGSIAFLVARPSFSMPRQKGSYRLCEISDVRALYISDVSLDVRRLKKSVKLMVRIEFEDVRWPWGVMRKEDWDTGMRVVSSVK
ncbi:hypothetical protein AXG93_517s1070 [Marchantia polymorpha subsp. ruderalis]|uniref:Uncharacterized protein n=1 Tax=Marchantia polymorpha subsp. ruderalis TaxID=1480154 RepID=A0A176VI52_MARPO|nr:hypothetical protein AXG93_517s1070 [Marchantia polymorpha subsp. ruderalis]